MVVFVYSTYPLAVRGWVRSHDAASDTRLMLATDILYRASPFSLGL